MFDLKKLRQAKLGACLPLLCGAALLAGCSKPVEKSEDIRPVRAMRLEAGGAQVSAEFSGEVRARVESRLGFRVGGKIVARRVELGESVKAGQVLLELDPQDLQLNLAQAQAAASAAESARNLAQAEFKRFEELRAKGFVSGSVLDAKEAQYKQALASHQQALAALQAQGNLASYTVLKADVAGVVSGLDAEAGHVVAAGAPLIRLARAGEKEVVFGIPEGKVGALRTVSDVRVRSWANPNMSLPAQLREVSAVADPVTRTYQARVAVPNAPDWLELGMTAFVSFSSPAPGAMPRVPLTALFQEKSQTSVWVVENGAVRLVPVQVGGTSGNDILLASGVTPGQAVVTAGVNLLKPGQKVKILGEVGGAQLVPAPVAPPAPSGVAK